MAMWIIGIAGGLALGGLTAAALFGTIIPIIAGAAAAGITLAAASAAKVNDEAEVVHRKLSQYPSYRY